MTFRNPHIERAKHSDAGTPTALCCDAAPAPLQCAPLRDLTSTPHDHVSPPTQEPPQESEEPAASQPQLAVEYEPEDLPSDDEVLVRGGTGWKLRDMAGI